MTDFINVILMSPLKEGQSPLMSFLPMLLIIVVFYFFLIRPQMRRQKEMKNFREALKKGDRVITTGGIYGKINNISENIVTVDCGNNVLLRVDKSALLRDASNLEQEQK
jgi:preprotein translocase subunit YajC